MIVAIADTHTTIWYLFSDSRLGKAASDFIDSAVVTGDHIGVSAISTAEMIYLVERVEFQPAQYEIFTTQQPIHRPFCSTFPSTNTAP